MKKTILVLLLSYSVSIFSQDCDCKSNFEWVKETFEKNDAGFSHVIEKKGVQVYKNHNKTFYNKVKGIKNVSDCKNAISEWLSFFRSGHLRVKVVNQNKSHIKVLKNRENKVNTYFKIIDTETAYLRVSTFKGSEKKIIDSIISANKETMLKTPNLIIDIRGNGGGNDSSYSELLPLLYTNPIRSIGVEFLSTPLNNQRMLDFINNPKFGFDQATKKWAKNAYNKLDKQKGSFVNLNSTIVDIITYKTIYEFPKKVGIIINGKNGSTAEQFLLDAKQSKKVKLFGTTTKGVLDISNMYFVKSPSGEFELGYCLSRSMRIPEMTIDGKGIQPDYYLDQNIKKESWVEFVTKSLKE